MKGELDFFRVIEQIVEKDPRYKSESYLFLMAALNFTVNRLDAPRHVTGQELLDGIRIYAIDQFGPMARTVLEHWGVYTTEDFGNIVFNIIDAKLLSKTQNDSIDDFKGIYDFRAVFDKTVEYKLE